MNDPISESWWLAAQLPPSNPTAPVTFEFNRRIVDPELTEVRQANDFLMHVEAVATYAKLFDLLRQFQQAATPVKNVSIERQVINMNQVGRVLSRTLKDFPDELRKQMIADFGAGSSEVQQLELAINEESSKEPYRLAMSIESLDSDFFEPAGNGVVVSPHVLSYLAKIQSSVTAQMNLAQVIYDAVIIAQRIVARQLKIYERKVRAASFVLRRTAAEIPDGVPLIVRADNLDGIKLAGKDIGPFSPQMLALDSALTLHRAIRRADELLRMTSLQPPASSEASTGASASAAEVPDVSPASVSGGSPNSGQSDAENTTATSANFDDREIDLEALADHAVKLADSLERVWSDALSPEALAPVHAEMEARISSLLATIQRRVSATQRRLNDAGVDTRMGPMPHSLEEIKLLSFEPDSNQKWRQAQMAQIDALLLLLEAVNAMRTPSAQSFDFQTGKTETWWEAGAFAMLRTRARLLVRVSHEVSAAADLILGGRVPDNRKLRRPFDTLTTASECLSYGNALGAVLHARLAIIEQSSLGGSPIPGDLIERLASDPQLTREAPVLELMQQTADRVLQGQWTDYSIPVIIAPMAIGIAQKLCLAEPQRIMAALRLEEHGEGVKQPESAEDENVADSVNGSVEE